MDLDIEQLGDGAAFNHSSSGTDHIEVIIKKGAAIKILSSSRADVTRGPDEKPPLG